MGIEDFYRIASPNRGFSSASNGHETGGEALVRALIDSNVRQVYGIPGTHTVPIYKALEKRKESITHTTTRHEQGAGFAAEGFARASGEVAAVCTITGVGVTNTLTSMASAMADSIPLLLISSEIPAYWEEKDSRQYRSITTSSSDLIPSDLIPSD